MLQIRMICNYVKMKVHIKAVLIFKIILLCLYKDKKKINYSTMHILRG